MSAGRSGSLTQWIFRQDLCSCAEKSFNTTVNLDLSGVSPRRIASSEATPEQDSVNHDIALEEEIDVDKESFPHDRYAPLAWLGTGASGEVFLCRDRLLNKKVALKTPVSYTHLTLPTKRIV